MEFPKMFLLALVNFAWFPACYFLVYFTRPCPVDWWYENRIGALVLSGIFLILTPFSFYGLLCLFRKKHSDRTSCLQCGAGMEPGGKSCPGCGAMLPSNKVGAGKLFAAYIIGSFIPAFFFFPKFLNLLSTYHRPSYCSIVKINLANMAIAQEAYFSDYDAYTTATSEPGLPGFKTGSCVKIATVYISKEGFVSIGSHPKCDKDEDGLPDVIVWDSANGGLQQAPENDTKISVELGILLAAAIGDRQMLDTYMAGYKSDISKIQLQGATTLSLAERGGHKEIVARLKATGAGKPAAP